MLCWPLALPDHHTLVAPVLCPCSRFVHLPNRGFQALLGLHHLRYRQFYCLHIGQWVCCLYICWPWPRCPWLTDCVRAQAYLWRHVPLAL